MLDLDYMKSPVLYNPTIFAFRFHLVRSEAFSKIDIG